MHVNTDACHHILPGIIVAEFQTLKERSSKVINYILCNITHA